MSDDFPKRSGLYRINDNINKLRLYLYLKEINSLLSFPKFELTTLTAIENWRKSHNNAVANTKTILEDEPKEKLRGVIIKWQEKILSPNEIAIYRESSNCLTEIQKRYHKWLSEGGGARVVKKVSKDAESSEGHQEVNTQTKVRKKRKCRKQRRRKSTENEATTEEERTSIEEIPIFTYIDEDGHQPEEDKEFQKKYKKNTNNNKTKSIPSYSGSSFMYVYTTLQGSKDTLLITLHWDDDERLLHIYPDFNDYHDNPYIIKIETDFCRRYAYAFENISPSADSDEIKTKLKRHLLPEFDMPPQNSQRIVLLLEIHEASGGFEYDYIHVRYYVRLPLNTDIEEGLLEASTHTSAANRNGNHHFGHCWQLSVIRNDCEDDDNIDSLCYFFFEVISIDGWQRERLEGFTYYALPLPASKNNVAATVVHRQRLHCLRPVDNFLDSLNRFFIGGRLRFDFKKFFLDTKSSTTPDTSPDSGCGAFTSPTSSTDFTSFHNRYGCRMQQTGELLFSCRLLLQRNSTDTKQLLLREVGITGRGGGMTVDDIMLAYREARKRLEAVVLN